MGPPVIMCLFFGGIKEPTLGVCLNPHDAVAGVAAASVAVVAVEEGVCVYVVCRRTQNRYDDAQQHAGWLEIRLK